MQFREIDDCDSLVTEDRNQLQERLELRKRQLQQLEQNSSNMTPKNIKKRQSSLTEFIE
jgi:hypothetical protein